MKKFITILMLIVIAATHFPTAIAQKNDVSPFFGEIAAEISRQYANGEYGEELFCLLTDGAWGSDGNIFIYTKAGTATLVYHQAHGTMDNRYKTRQLTDKEFSDFKSFIIENSVDTLEDWSTWAVMDATEYQYIHFTEDENNAVYMYAPDSSENEIYNEITKMFFNLTDTGEFDIRYDLSDTIYGVELLIKNEEYSVQSVWKNGDDFRVCINENGMLVWHSFKDGVIGDVTEEPDEIDLQNAWTDIPNTYKFSYQEHQNNFPWQCSWNSYCVRSLRSYDTNTFGLWLTKAGEEPILIKEGTYANSVVIPNTDFVVCANAEYGWAKPNTIVKINLQTFEEEVLDIEKADTLEPVAYINGKLLVNRDSEKYLFDMETGSKEQIYGDFVGMIGYDNLRERFLQSTGVENEYYTVDNSVEECVIGKINTETFTFTPIAEYEDIYFDTMDTWVDEENQKAYVVVNADLISLPLNPKFRNDGVKVMVNGEMIDFDQPPVIINDRVMVPVRAVCEKLGATVEWDGVLREAVIYNDDVKLAIGVGKDYFIKFSSGSSSHISLDASAQIIGDRVLLPIRAVCESLGATVNWNESERIVEVEK